jgi:hypothetical protein
MSDRVALVCRFLEGSFPGQRVTDWQEPGTLVYSVDDERGWPCAWLAVSEDALSYRDIDLAAQSTPALLQM